LRAILEESICDMTASSEEHPNHRALASRTDHNHNEAKWSENLNKIFIQDMIVQNLVFICTSDE